MKDLFAKIFKLDKRKDQRFLIDDHELIIYDPNSPQEKQIVDLSPGGVSFVYETDEDGKELEPVFDLDIKVGDVFHLGKIRVKTISDVVISEDANTSLVIRRLSARFINITIPQQYELKKFLKSYGKTSK